MQLATLAEIDGLLIEHAPGVQMRRAFIRDVQISSAPARVVTDPFCERCEVSQVNRIPSVGSEFRYRESTRPATTTILHLLDFGHANGAEMLGRLLMESVDEAATFRGIIHTQELKDGI